VRRLRLLRALERSLFASGLVCLGVYASACAERSFFQHTQSREFDRAIVAAMQTDQHDQAEWSPKRVARFEESRLLEVTTLGRLDIPTAAVSVMVLDGTDEVALDRAVGRIEGTAEPDEEGNLGIAGHRDGIFRGLRNVEIGDELTLATRGGVGRYRVSELLIVEPEDVHVLDATDHRAITLVTCFPFYFIGSAPQRYVVRADAVEFESWTEESLAHYADRSGGALAALH
jgi:sortase A